MAVNINIATPTLQEVTDSGNTTNNDVAFTDNAGILLENTSRLREGTIDSGAGGGIAQICAVGYELKWEAGSQYVMDGNGLLIREVNHKFNIVPDLNNDDTQGYYVGSRWVLDNGDVYICTDSTSTAAVWEIVANADWNATSGSTAIANKPSIPAAQVNADWNATSGVAEILNKPTIPSVTGFVPYTGATNDLDMGTHNVTADHISLNVSPSGAGFVVGSTQWNNTIGSSETLLKGGNVTIKNGVDLVARIVNKVTPNTTLTKANYQAVRVSGAQGGRLAINLAQANNDNNSADTIGLVTETIATNQEGFIITVGQLENINTTGSLQGETWVDGDVLYLSPTTAGRLTNIKPTAPGHIVVIGYVEYAHAINGKIYVKIMNGWELDELHNVAISSVADNNLLQYDSATSLWKNESLSTAGIQPTLVSATNIKTINGNSLLGSGDLVISGGGGGITVGTTAVTSGTVGRVFFQGTGDVVQQSSSLFWDNTNSRLGVGATPATTVRLDVRAQGALSTDIAFRVRNSADSANVLTVNGLGQVWSNGKGFQSQNTAFGQLSLNSCTTGNNNTAFGYNALATVTTLTTNSAFGSGALQLTTGESNTAVGFGAGQINGTGSYNTYLGYAAGSNGTTATGSVFIGFGAGQNSNSQYGVFIGYTASTQGGNGTVAIGYGAGAGTGSLNLSIGQSAGVGMTTGTINTHLGYRSVASGVTTGNYNNLLGSDIVIGNVSNNAVLADNQGNQAIRKDANHNVLLGREVALATNATNGFAYLPTCAGVPTGVPAASFTGKAPIVIDSTNNKMYIYTNAAWVALN